MIEQNHHIYNQDLSGLFDNTAPWKSKISDFLEAKANKITEDYSQLIIDLKVLMKTIQGNLNKSIAELVKNDSVANLDYNPEFDEKCILGDYYLPQEIKFLNKFIEHIEMQISKDDLNVRALTDFITALDFASGYGNNIDESPVFTILAHKYGLVL
jgi:hypothetical protein